MLTLIHQLMQTQVAQAIVIAVLTGIVTLIFERRGRLLYGVAHNFMYLLPPPNQGEGPQAIVTSKQVYFENPGRAAIKDVEILLSHRPGHFEIWQPRAWTEEIISNERCVVKLASLNGGEFFQLQMLEFGAHGPPDIIWVKWDGGMGKPVQMGFERQIAQRWKILIALLCLSGASAVIYIIIELGTFLFDVYQRLPAGP